MSKKSVYYRNEKRLAMYAKYKNIRNELKKKIKNTDLSLNERIKFVLQLDALPKNSSKVRIRNRCPVTGSSKGLVYFKEFGLSRIPLYQEIIKCNIVGVRINRKQ